LAKAGNKKSPGTPDSYGLSIAHFGHKAKFIHSPDIISIHIYNV